MLVSVCVWIFLSSLQDVRAGSGVCVCVCETWIMGV